MSPCERSQHANGFAVVAIRPYPLNFEYHSGLLALNRLDIPGNKSLALTSL